MRWLAGHGYIDEDMAEHLAERAREASRDLPMADRLATLLHEVADGAPEVEADALAEEDWVEDHLAISDVEPGRIWFEGDVGPIVVPRKASDLARPGWSAFVTTARDRWDLAAARGRLRLPLIARVHIAAVLRAMPPGPT